MLHANLFLGVLAATFTSTPVAPPGLMAAQQSLEDHASEMEEAEDGEEAEDAEEDAPRRSGRRLQREEVMEDAGGAGSPALGASLAGVGAGGASMLACAPGCLAGFNIAMCGILAPFCNVPLLGVGCLVCSPLSGVGGAVGALVGDLAGGKARPKRAAFAMLAGLLPPAVFLLGLVGTTVMTGVGYGLALVISSFVVGGSSTRSTADSTAVTNVALVVWVAVGAAVAAVGVLGMLASAAGAGGLAAGGYFLGKAVE